MNIRYLSKIAGKKAQLGMVAALSLCLVSSLQARVWTSKDGKKLDAAFVALDGDKVELRLKNGKTVKVPLDRLVKADAEAAKRFTGVGDNSATQASAKRIDGLLAKNLKKAGIKGFNEALPDDLFVRRVYLDIIGRIPTREEFMRFAENTRPDKRSGLIDELLTHPGYSSHMFNYFADMFRLKGKIGEGGGRRAEPYIKWWQDQLEGNTPYDQIVTKMITATGNIGHNPASGFLLRDAGMEFDAFANFSQVFLGIDISCAQCHDHPFAEWTQMDFYRMAAFFGNTQRIAPGSAMGGMMGKSGGEKTKELVIFAKKNGVPTENRQLAYNFYRYLNFMRWDVKDDKSLETQLPHDFSGSGGKPGSVVRPRTLLGGAAKKGGKTRREALADWMTSPDNPRFAMVIANRMWDRAFGKPLIGPITDFEEDSVCGQPQVLAFVTSEMKRVNYDLREFMRILYNTRAYQGLATTVEPSSTKAYLFAGPVLRRMKPEQAWDSLLLLASGSKIDEVKGRDGSFMRSVMTVDFNKDSVEEIFAKYQAYDKNFRRLGAIVVSEPGELQGAAPSVPKMGKIEMIRAAQMLQPAPAASLLDTFGQSDREVTDEHSLDGSVPQVLALMNGSVTERMTGGSSKIVQDLEVLDAIDDKVRGVFFTMLSRYPSDDELKLGMKMMEDFGEDDGISDLAWALMNSPEFLFVQ
ncbi:MAG: DUF1549 domain-containing protein [Verrucomicrobiales bacterium]|nr:DUF1549 domain-containing protein [Verrucomicrobiales bacterium]